MRGAMLTYTCITCHKGDKLLEQSLRLCDFVCACLLMHMCVWVYFP